ncbi:hypothetical protein BDQ17DRAFT_1272836 [Cyathus striatus]|nr:hypothetical protein BDQ17DRAFT_1272836 [Cyathus striatus]
MAPNIPPTTEAEDLSRSRKRRKMTHAEEEIDQKEVYNLSPWADMSSSKTFVTAEERLHDEILEYVNYVGPTREEAALREGIFLAVQAVVKWRFPYAEVQRHGSAVTGLSLPGADIDVCVTMRCYNVKSTLFTLKSALLGSSITNDVFVKHTARVPILTLTTLPEYGPVSVDLGINNDDGITSLGIISGYMQKMPALKPLVLIMKGFLKQRGLADPSRGGIGSYAVILMCISFLQLNPSKRPKEYITDPNGSRSLGHLLTDFMLYYGSDFPYATSYISVPEGKVLPKEGHEWIDTRVEYKLATECLVGREHDVSKSLDTRHLGLMVQAFKSAYDDLARSTLQLPVGLGVIVSVNQKMVEHRQHIKDIVGQGAVQRLPSTAKDINNQGSSSYGYNSRPSYRGAFQDNGRLSQHSGPSLLSRLQAPPDLSSRLNAIASSSRSSGTYDDRSREHRGHRSDQRDRSSGRESGRLDRSRHDRRPRISTMGDVVASALEKNEGRKRDSNGRRKGDGG